MSCRQWGRTWRGPRAVTVAAIWGTLLGGAAAASVGDYVEFNGHYYGLTNAASNWTDAETAAITSGGHLVSITDASEQSFIETTFLTGDNDARPLWIGLTDESQEGTFVWTSGEVLSYTNWEPGEPNDFPPGEDYGAINWHRASSGGSGVKGTWNDAPLEGSFGAGGSSDGPYRGIIELNATAVIFADGLESGSTTYWSAVAP